jgi:hypothetical protein
MGVEVVSTGGTEAMVAPRLPREGDATSAPFKL